MQNQSLPLHQHSVIVGSDSVSLLSTSSPLPFANFESTINNNKSNNSTSIVNNSMDNFSKETSDSSPSNTNPKPSSTITTDSNSNGNNNNTTNANNDKNKKVRKRTTRACDQCNQLRTKCDGMQPCAHCKGMPILNIFFKKKNP